MPIEGFDYQNFAQVLASQASELVPAEMDENQKNYIVGTLNNFSTLAGEALSNDTSLNFDANQAMLVVQIIAEWCFHKSVDLIKSGVPQEHWDEVLQKVAFTIFELTKQAIVNGMEQQQILQVVEQNVKETFETALNELKQNGAIGDEVANKALNQSNIDDMTGQVQQEQEQGQIHSQEPSQTSEKKLLKLASVALVLRQLPHERIQAMISKFNQNDANIILQYMQMPDLETKVDKDIARQYLEEIKVNLPEPKTANPNKLIKRFNQLTQQKGREKIDVAVFLERSKIKDFVKEAYSGEYLDKIPPKVGSIIIKHIEETV